MLVLDGLTSKREPRQEQRGQDIGRDVQSESGDRKQSEGNEIEILVCEAWNKVGQSGGMCH